MGNMNLSFSGANGLALAVAVLGLSAMVMLHVLFASCVWIDANWVRQQGRPLVLLPPFVWSLASLLLGLTAVAFYWLCHYSRLSRRDI